MAVSSLKFNILASYVSQIYLVIISIAILPIYMKYMGAEAYGLVGFLLCYKVFLAYLILGLLQPLAGKLHNTMLVQNQL